MRRETVLATDLKRGDVLATMARPKVLEVTPGDWYEKPAVAVALDSTPNAHPFFADTTFEVWRE